MRVRVAIGFCAVMATFQTASAHAEECRRFDGWFVSVFDVGPGCPDSTTLVPQCTHGRLYADEALTQEVATYEFSFTSQGYGGSPDDPVRLVFGGTSVITESDGTVLRGDDDGELWLNPTDRGQFSFQTRVHPYEECPPNEPCHPLSQASSIVADGDLDLVTNTTVGTYAGQICTPDP